jgi:hypothetical protein
MKEKVNQCSQLLGLPETSVAKWLATFSPLGDPSEQ